MNFQLPCVSTFHSQRPFTSKNARNKKVQPPIFHLTAASSATLAQPGNRVIELWNYPHGSMGTKDGILLDVDLLDLYGKIHVIGR